MLAKRRISPNRIVSDVALLCISYSLSAILRPPLSVSSSDRIPVPLCKATLDHSPLKRTARIRHHRRRLLASCCLSQRARCRYSFASPPTTCFDPAATSILPNIIGDARILAAIRQSRWLPYITCHAKTSGSARVFLDGFWKSVTLPR